MFDDFQFQSLPAQGFLPPGANVCVAAPSSQGWSVGRGCPQKFLGYFNVEIPYFRDILVLTVKIGKARQRATVGILGGMPPPPKSAYGISCTTSSTTSCTTNAIHNKNLQRAVHQASSLTASRTILMQQVHSRSKYWSLRIRGLIEMHAVLRALALAAKRGCHVLSCNDSDVNEYPMRRAYTW